MDIIKYICILIRHSFCLLYELPFAKDFVLHVVCGPLGQESCEGPHLSSSCSRNAETWALGPPGPPARSQGWEGGFRGLHLLCEFALPRSVKILGCKDGFSTGNPDKSTTRRCEWTYCCDSVMPLSVSRATAQRELVGCASPGQGLRKVVLRLIDKQEIAHI